MEKFKFLGKDKISKLPKGPGVYAFSASAPTRSELRRIRRSSPATSVGGKKGREFLNAKHSRFLTKSRFLYIGKASNIRERVKNHFSRPGFRNSRFINETEKVGYLRANSEIEALISEANLIKKYQPKYNVIWRDDKNYFFVAVTKEDFPRIFWTHQPKLQATSYKLQAKFIGPFVDGKALKQTLKILRKVFPYRSCKALPKKPCLWYQLGKCPAPCLLKSNLAKQIPSVFLRLRKECQGNAKNIIEILQGKRKLVLKSLKEEMKKASASKKFERAAKIRDQIKALEKIFAHARLTASEAAGFGEQAKILAEPSEILGKKDWSQIQKTLQNILKTRKKISRVEAYDISNIQGKEAAGSMVTFINGRPVKNFYRKFKIRITGKPNDIAMMKEVLKRRLKHSEWPFADLILIDGGKAQLNAALNSKFQIPNSKKIKIIALAKKRNELYLENQENPILLENLPREIFNLILQLRDEAHRFAITYHRKLRRMMLRQAQHQS